MRLKPKFEEKYSKLTNVEEYKKSIKEFAKKSIRVNTLLYSIQKVKKSLEKDGWILEKIPWCKEGFYIEHKTGRRDIGNIEQHKKGMLFSQGSASMIPPLLMKLKDNFRVLDLCAAPGGKTQHIACIMNNKGKIIANDHNSFRRNILKMNMKRCGVKNVKITGIRGEYFKDGEFDAILVDAPCTGSGLIKGKIARTKKLLKEWNPKVIEKYSAMQKKIIENAYSHLKKGGRLVYSTCSLEPEEDEDVIEWLAKNNKGCRIIKPGINVKSSLKKYIKIWPQYYDAYGFFVGVVEKS